MSLLTSKAATEVAAEEEEEEEDGEGEAGRKILKLVLDGGGTNITAKCLGPFRDRIIVGEVVKRQYVFECGWGRWRPLQTSGQGCGQVRKSPWFPYPYTSPIEFYLVLLKYTASRIHGHRIYGLSGYMVNFWLVPNGIGFHTVKILIYGHL